MAVHNAEGEVEGARMVVEHRTGLSTARENVQRPA